MTKNGSERWQEKQKDVSALKLIPVNMINKIKTRWKARKKKYSEVVRNCEDHFEILALYLDEEDGKSKCWIELDVTEWESRKSSMCSRR